MRVDRSGCVVREPTPAASTAHRITPIRLIQRETTIPGLGIEYMQEEFGGVSLLLDLISVSTATNECQARTQI